ncbi:MAG: hypothetical protein Q4C95_06820 [Planctomycetia bacterium]|nr:hypothetical protein [Planctomycetia bacterium]
MEKNNNNNQLRQQNKKSSKHLLTDKLFLPMTYGDFWLAFLILSLVGMFFLFGIVGQLGFIAILMFYAIYIFEASASGDNTLTQYPSFDILDSVVHMIWFLYVIFMAIFPGVLLRKIIFLLLGLHLTESVSAASDLAPFVVTTPIYISLFCLAGSFFLFLPIFILSGMLNNSPFNLYSPEILQSLRNQKKLWGTFYLFSLIFLIVIYAFLFVSFWQLFSVSKALESKRLFLLGFNGIIGAVTTGAVFFYFRLIGRLAFVLKKKLKKQKTNKNTKD